MMRGVEEGTPPQAGKPELTWEEQWIMKIVVLTGSPHKKGTTALLADRFCEGAASVGHEVTRFDAGLSPVPGCMACDGCRRNGPAPCVRGDAMNELAKELVRADAVVFVTPLYYFGMSAQLKAVVDRFYAVNADLMGGKRTALLAASADDRDWTMSALVAHYETIARYLKWEDMGHVLATGCSCRADAEKTDYPTLAYELGQTIGEAADDAAGNDDIA